MCADYFPFNRQMATDWAHGLLSSKQVQLYAPKAMQQGADNVERLAKMGNYGLNPQNLCRAMRTMLGLPAGAPEMDWYI